jgi:hypothetical protein
MATTDSCVTTTDLQKYLTTPSKLDVPKQLHQAFTSNSCLLKTIEVKERLRKTALDTMMNMICRELQITVFEFTY